MAGNAMTLAKTWSFTTGAQADTTPPTITSRTPASGATGVAIGSSIAATFIEAVQSGTLTGTTFTLKNSAGTSIAGTVTYDSTSKTAALKPSGNLAYSTSYTTTLTNGIKDIAGNALATTSWSFTTVAAPSSSTCNTNLPISGATSSPTQTGFTANNAIDNTPTTKWWSTFSVNPWIKLDLGSSKSICSVDIAWADGNQRQYTFKIEISTDGNSFSNVFSGKSSGTTTPQKYSFAETSGRYVKITITQSHFGSSNSLAQISELDVFGKISTGSDISGFITSNSLKWPESGTSMTEGEKIRIIDDRVLEQSPSISTDPILNQSEIDPVAKQDDDKVIEHDTVVQTVTPNSPPIAKNDRSRSESNEKVVINVLANDREPDGEDLKVTFVSVPPDNVGKVMINKDQTITFIPQTDLAGKITLPYEISDESGKSDKAKIYIVIKPANYVGSLITEAPDHESKYTRGQGEMENDHGKKKEINHSTQLRTNPPENMETENIENNRVVPRNSTEMMKAKN
jgi:hypothetical protein